MKVYNKIRLVMIGLVNVLVFAFIPPFITMMSRIVSGAPRAAQNNEIVSGLDIPDRASNININFLFLLLAILITGIVGYVNYILVRRELKSFYRNMKFWNSFIPFAIWAILSFILISTGIWGTYILFSSQDGGSFFGGSYVTLRYFSLLLLDGISLLVASPLAFCLYKNKYGT